MNEEIRQLEMEIELLKGANKLLEDEVGLLKRTASFRDREYLAAHGGSWGRCLYQDHTKVLRSTVEGAIHWLVQAGKAIAILSDRTKEPGYDGYVDMVKDYITVCERALKDTERKDGYKRD